MERNQHTLEKIYKENYALLLNYGLKFSRDRELIKDCIQDVFVKIHRSKKLPEVTSERAYLLRALRNTIYNRIYAIKEITDLEFALQLPDTTDLFEEFFSKNDEELLMAKRLLQAIHALPSNQKTALYLRYIKELSYPEIAEIMGVKVQSSMNLISRSLTKLRTLLKQDYLILILLFIGK